MVHHIQIANGSVAKVAERYLEMSLNLRYEIKIANTK